MKDLDIIQLLEKVGLTKSEANVYLSLLELGNSSIGKIIERSGVSSSKVYEILDRLMQKGLASYILEQNTKHYNAAPPKRIIEYLQEREEEIKQQANEIKEILPQLEVKQHLAEHPSEATVYKGMRGLHAAFYNALDNLKVGEEFLAMNVPKRSAAVNRFFTHFAEAVEKKGHKGKWIFNEEAKGELQTINNQALRKFKAKRTPAAINILGNHTIIFPNETNEPLLIDIHNKDVAESFKKQFEEEWNQDVSVSKGIDAFEQVFEYIFSTFKKGETYCVLNATFSHEFMKVKYEKFFEKVHAKRQQLGIKVKLLFHEENIETTKKFRGTSYKKDAELKFIPSQDKSPVTIYPAKEKTFIVVQDAGPTVITINNTIITKSYQKQFDTLWNQEARVEYGLDAIQNLFDEMIEAESADYIGARGYFIDKRQKYIDEWEKRAKKKGFKMRNLVDPEVKGHRITTFDFAETKYTLPKEYANLSVFWIYGEKVVISNWVGKEPLVVIIENKQVHDLYKKQFELLWNQKHERYVGGKGVEIFFDQTLEAKDVYFIGGNFGIKKTVPNYWKTFKKRRLEKQSIWHDLLDAEVDPKTLGKEPYYECRILSKEVQSPHVIGLFNNKVANIIWDGENTIITTDENKELYDSYKKHFDYLWKNSSEVKMKKT